MRNLRSDWRSTEGGYFTLIGLLAAIVIIGILFTLYGGGFTGGSSQPGGAATTIGGTKDRAQDVLCQTNLQQLRYAISIHQGNMGSYPPSLGSLESSASLAFTCPVGEEPYEYDPGSGTVRCPHPGHGSF